MAIVEESALSRSCHRISQYLELYIGSSKVDVLIGDPKSAENYLKSQAVDNAKDVVNIFIYKIEGHEFDASVHPDGLWRIRAHALITPFSLVNRTDVENPPSSGEVDLRLLGQVLAAFHEKPVMDELPLDDISSRLNEHEKNIRVQAIFQSLSSEDINHIWSNVGEVGYRTSVAYEFSLIPVIPRSQLIEGPLVTDVLLDVNSIKRNDSTDQWVPEIRLVVDSICFESLRFRTGESALNAFIPKILIVGPDLNEEVNLIVSQWQKGERWKTIKHQLANVNALQMNCSPANESNAANINLSNSDKNKVGQISIVAERTYQRPSDNKSIKIHSNLLVVNIDA